MLEVSLEVDLIHASAPDPASGHVALLAELADDALSRSLGDADTVSDIPEAQLRVAGNAHQNQALTGERRALRHPTMIAETGIGSPEISEALLVS